MEASVDEIWMWGGWDGLWGKVEKGVIGDGFMLMKSGEKIVWTNEGDENGQVEKIRL